MASRSDPRPPWKRKNPKAKSTGLSGSEKHEAKQRARKAGRKYPNLVDNMAVARKKKTQKANKTKKR
jgi:hypothetical protein